MIFHSKLNAQVFTRKPGTGRHHPGPGAQPVTVSQGNPAGAGALMQHVDLAGESSEQPRQNIFVQSGTVRLTRANPTPPSVLRLLQ